MSKRKVLIIIPDRLKHPMGGMGIALASTLPYLQEDFDIEVVGFPEENDLSYYRGASNPLPQIVHGSLVTLIGQISYVQQALKGDHPNIVHAYDWSVYLAGVQVADHFKARLVVTMQLSVNLLAKHGISYVAQPQSPDGFAIQKALCEMEVGGLKKANHIIQISKAYAKEFEVISDLGEKTSIVPHGVSYEEWQKGNKITLPGNRRVKLVYIGRFAFMKGIHELCKAIIPSEIDLIFVGEQGGDPFFYNMMIQKTQSFDNVHFVGPLYGQGKVDVLTSADAVIMPSLHEPFGIVALEALASGSLLLSSFKDGLSDFLTKDSAVDCGTTASTIEAALKQLVLMTDEEKNIRIAKGYEIAKAYSWHNSAAKIKEVYEKVSQTT